MGSFSETYIDPIFLDTKEKISRTISLVIRNQIAKEKRKGKKKGRKEKSCRDLSMSCFVG